MKLTRREAHYVRMHHERCTPSSGLTNRLSTSHERQKGFIPESPEHALIDCANALCGDDIRKAIRLAAMAADGEERGTLKYSSEAPSRYRDIWTV